MSEEQAKTADIDEQPREEQSTVDGSGAEDLADDKSALAVAEISSSSDPADRELSPEEEAAAKAQAEEVAKNDALKAPGADGEHAKPEIKMSEDAVAAAGAIVDGFEARGKIYDSVLHAIGNTPLVKVPRLSQIHGCGAELLAKLDYCNPLSTSKDREAFAIISDAENAGLIKPGENTLIEASSGNMAVSLAFVAAAKGYKLILVMPESVSFERRSFLKLLGADLEMSPPESGMKGAVDKIPALLKQHERSVHLNQFTHASCAQIHSETTAEEIWADCGGAIDALVIGVGSGALMTGVAGALKAKKPDIRVFAVEPAGSAILSGKAAGAHKIQGLGAGFVPAILDPSLIDHVVQISDEQCFAMARDMAKTEGLAGGLASGAVMAAAIEVAKIPDFSDKRVVAILTSALERYIGTPLFEQG